MTNRTRAKKGSGDERKASLTIRIDQPTERALSAIAVREGRSVSDVTRRLIRVGIDTYEPEDKRPAVPNTRKLANLSTLPPGNTVADLADRLKALAGDAVIPPEHVGLLSQVLENLARTLQKSSLVGEARTAEVPAPVVAEKPPSAEEIDSALLERPPSHADPQWSNVNPPGAPFVETNLPGPSAFVKEQLRQNQPPFDSETDAMRVRRRSR